MKYQTNEVDVNDMSVTFLFTDKTTVKYYLEDITDERILNTLALHGLKQKLCDKFSDAKHAPNPLDFVKESIVSVFKHLKEGQWKSTRGMGASLQDLIMAVYDVAMKDGIETTLEDVALKLRGMDSKQRAAVKKMPKVNLRLAEILAERGTEESLKSLFEDEDEV